MVSNVGAGLGKNVIVTEDGRTYKKAGKAKSTGAVIAANVAGGLVLRGGQKLVQKPMMMALKDMNSEGNAVFKNVIDEAFIRSDLAEKGVKIIDATAENRGKITSAVKKCLPKWVRNMAAKNKQLLDGVNSKIGQMTDSVVKGKNAFFVPKANIIAVNKDKMSVAAFHEMGHAMNKHFGGFAKILQKTRAPFMALTSLALLTALFKRKKADGEKPQGVFDKATTFIKNNCGKIAFLGFLPTILEEGAASIKGAKLAKGLISAEQLKALNKFNGKAWLTYAGTAVATGLGAFVISKVRDSIAHPTEIKPRNPKN